MKKKIGEIYNKPIVIGNKNEITKNEVHISNFNTSTSGEGGGDESNVEYIDLSGLDDSAKKSLFGYAILAKQEDIILPPFTFSQLTVSTVPSAIAIDFNVEICAVSLGIGGKLGNLLQTSGFDTASLPRITKEEFYNLNAY